MLDEDRRYFYSAVIGAAYKISISDTSQSLELPPGRYVAYPRSFAGGTQQAWVQQGASAVVAVTDTPSTPLGENALGAIEFTVSVSPANSGDVVENHIACIADAGVTGELFITKISRGKI